LSEHLFVEMRGNVLGCEKINGYAKQIFQLVLQATQIEQGYAGKGVYQEVEVTSFLISAFRNRAKDTWVGCAVALDQSSQRSPVPLKAQRWGRGALVRLSCWSSQDSLQPTPLHSLEKRGQREKGSVPFIVNYM